MAKTLDFTDMSPRTVKIGDTTTSFTLICGNNNMATDLTNATSITVKLGNASGYLKSVTVDPASLTDSTADQVTVTFTADLMTSLPAGGYTIEVWVVDSTGTSIYPSDGSTGFTIDNNIQSANGSTITTITFDDFVKAMNEAAGTIAKGDKGDPGEPGLQGTMGLDFTQQDVTNIPAGFRYFDTTLNKPIWYTGTTWVDSLGQPPYFTVGLSRVNMSSEIKHYSSINVNMSPTTDDAKTDETELNN